MRLFVVLGVIALIASAAATNSFKALLLDTLNEVKQYAINKLAEMGEEFRPSQEFPYFNIMPIQVAVFNAHGVPTQWSTPCFSKNIGSVTKSEDGTQFILKITSTGPNHDTEKCTDDYLTATVSFSQDFLVSTSVKPTPSVTTEIAIDIPTDLTVAENWDIETKGIRLYKFINSPAQTISNLLATIGMFVPEATKRVPPRAAAANIDFMTNYPKFPIYPRNATSNLPPNEKLVHSGDLFSIMRLDGLNPMLGWAMGSTTGHVTTALWMDGNLMVCESTIADSYWPTDNVQCTPYRQWLKQAQEADFQVVWSPLKPQARAKYNEAAAIEFFKSVEGLEYGFKNMLFGWIDTAKDNFPCLPPDYSSNCLTWEFAEVLLALVDRKIPEIGEKMWNSALAMRLGVSDKLRTADLYMIGSKSKGLSSIEVVQIPENDSWLYNTTRNGEPAVGKVMVCCVFVCNMWKAAGVFGDLDFNCGEMTNWDDYSLNILQTDYQQIIGDYTLVLNDYGERQPYAHMADHCESLAPNYVKSPNC